MHAMLSKVYLVHFLPILMENYLLSHNLGAKLMENYTSFSCNIFPPSATLISSSNQGSLGVVSYTVAASQVTSLQMYVHQTCTVHTVQKCVF